MAAQWIKRDGADVETYDLNRGEHVRGYVARYNAGVGPYNWQAWRGLFNYVSDSADTAEEAMAEAERVMALDETQFNARVAAGLYAQRDEINAKLRDLNLADDDPYRTGYAAGFEAARAAILAALETHKAKVTA